VARGRQTRAGSTWRPVGVRRVAGRSKRKLPSLRIPRLPARWPRYAVAVGAVLAVAVGTWSLYNSPLLEVQEVKVEGYSAVPPELVRATSGLEGESLILPDFEAAEARLKELPVVKDAQVSRDLPTGVKVTIIERRPWGVWQLGGARYVVDEEGVVLDLPAPQAPPLIVQTDASVAALNVGDRVDEGAMEVATKLVATSEQTIGRTVRSLEFSQRTGLSVLLSSPGGGPDLRVVFGDSHGFDFKVASLFAVLAEADEQGRELSRIDLRFGERVAVQ